MHLFEIIGPCSYGIMGSLLATDSKLQKPSARSQAKGAKPEIPKISKKVRQYFGWLSKNSAKVRKPVRRGGHHQRAHRRELEDRARSRSREPGNSDFGHETVQSYLGTPAETPLPILREIIG